MVLGLVNKILSLWPYRKHHKTLSVESQVDGLKMVAKPSPHVLIQSQKACREVFSKETLRPKNLGLGNLFGRWLGSCLGCLNNRDPAWSSLKRVFKPLFDIQSEDDDNLIKEWDQDIQKLFQTTQSTEKPVSIESVVANLPLRFILRKIFGNRFVEQYCGTFKMIQEDASHLMSKVFSDKLAKWWFYQYLPTDTNRILRNFQREWKLILEHANDSQYVKDEGIYHQLLTNYQNHSEELTYEMFSQTLAEIVYANQDVTIPSATHLLTHYSLYPLPEDLNSFIEESARLAPVFPTSMPKILTKDVTIDDVVIPKGTTVLIDFTALGKSSDWKMDDLDLFKPERFNDLKMQEFVGRFGFGGRRCPGSKLANNLFRRMLEHLKNNWILIPSHPTNLNSIEKDPSRPFSLPLFDVWLVPQSHQCKLGSRSIYYDCPPMSENKERALMVISINKRSPFLTDQKRVDMAVQYLSEMEIPSVIMIADEIAQYNMQAFDHHKPEKAVREAKKLGDQFAEKFLDAIQRLGQGKVKFCRWADLNMPKDIETHLLTYPELKSRVDAIANKFLNHRGQGKVDTSYADKINLVTKYIMSEIPVLINGIKYQGESYRLLYYCGSRDHLSKFAGDKGSLHTLILDILNKPEFAKVKAEIARLTGIDVYKVPGFIGIDIEKV